MMYRHDVSLLAFAILQVNGLIITTDQGALNGTLLKARNGKLFNAFLGIPYAKPPVGQLRFKAPVMADPWTGIRDATIDPPPCIQIAPADGTIHGSEDCLYLNVYTPLNARQGDNVPVIVYIYGSIFMYDNITKFGPNYMMNHDVIIVMPTYRLGVLGYLSTEDPTIPGNFQLKDQVLALKWVQKTIPYFGGNPNQVTLHGHSTGAICAHLHTMSPASKGLFHRVIMQSGSAISPKLLLSPGLPRSLAKKFAREAGCPRTDTSQQIHQCVMYLDADIFPKISNRMFIWDSTPTTLFTPTIEHENVADAFINQSPYTMKYHSTHLPWITGVTSAEETFKLPHFFENGGKLVAEIDQHYEILLPHVLNYIWHTEPHLLNDITRKIRKYYFGDKEIGERTARQLTDILSWSYWYLPAIDTIRNYPGPKYVYYYDYRANFSFLGHVDALGVAHSADLHLILQNKESIRLLSQQDIAFSEELVKRFINFVYSSNPNYPDNINQSIMAPWEPVTSQRIEHLYINLNGSMRTDLLNESYNFWHSLPIGGMRNVKNNDYSRLLEKIDFKDENGENGSSILQTCHNYFMTLFIAVLDYIAM